MLGFQPQLTEALGLVASTELEPKSRPFTSKQAELRSMWAEPEGVWGLFGAGLKRNRWKTEAAWKVS